MMISFEEAFNITMAERKTLSTERVNFMNAKDRVVAEDIFSDINIPPFNKSAMDGYACRGEDIQNELEVLEIIQAGKTPKFKIGQNQCSKIMTGAMIPDGADTVIIVENVDIIDYKHIKHNIERTSTNICWMGEDLKKGEILVAKGTKIKAAHLPLLATVGAVNPLVFCKPKVGIIVTGTELAEPGEILQPGKIRNSNAYSILALLEDLGISGIYYGICEDDHEIGQNFLDKAVNDCDVIIFSGAVSMGDFDFVPELLMKNHVDIKYHGIEVKPGKRMLFGTSKDGKYFFGLPGNPVSAFVQFNFLIKPFILQLMGGSPKTLDLHLPLANDFKRKKGDKKEFLPARINSKGEVEMLTYNGSAHLTSLAEADCLATIEVGVTMLGKGEPLKIFLIN